MTADQADEVSRKPTLRRARGRPPFRQAPDVNPPAQSEFVGGAHSEGRRVEVEASEASWSVQVLVPEIIVSILGAPDPVVGEGVFDAAPERPSDKSVAAAERGPAAEVD